MKKHVDQALDKITDETEFSTKMKKKVAVLLLILAAYLTTVPYTGKVLFFKVDRSITPDFISSVAGISLLLPMYGRGLIKWSFSIYGVAMFVLFLMIYAAIIKLAFMGGGNIPIYLVAASITLAWLGLRAIAGFGWILAFLAAVISAVTTSDAMGFSGFIFVCSSFLGLLMHSDVSPQKMVKDIQSEYQFFSGSVATSVKKDISAAGDTLHK